MESSAVEYYSVWAQVVWMAEPLVGELVGELVVA